MKPAAIKPAVSSAATIGVASLFNNHYLCPMFTFKQFIIEDAHCAMKVGTDGVLLGAWADVAGCHHITDIGCGSGLIALMAAQRAPEARVTGVEIDPEAVADAAPRRQPRHGTPHLGRRHGLRSPASRRLPTS